MKRNMSFCLPENMLGRHFRAWCLGSVYHITHLRTAHTNNCNTMNIHRSHAKEKTKKAIHPHFFKCKCYTKNISRQNVDRNGAVQKSNAHWLHFILHCLIIYLCPGCFFCSLFFYSHYQWELHSVTCCAKVSWAEWAEHDVLEIWMHSDWLSVFLSIWKWPWRHCSVIVVWTPTSIVFSVADQLGISDRLPMFLSNVNTVK